MDLRAHGARWRAQKKGKMKILDVKQGTDEWLDARLGLVTASELGALISPTWKIRTGDGPRTYLYRKIAEAWLCKPVNTFGSFTTEQGQVLEPEARPWFELAHDCEVSTKSGFIVGDDGRCGASPVGLIKCQTCGGLGMLGGHRGQTAESFDQSGEPCEICFGGFTAGIEIKCPQETNAVRYAIEGVLPADYELQVHGSLYVTGFPRWHFLSYSRHLPKFHIVVERREDRCQVIADALAGFYERFDAEWEKLSKLAEEPRINPFKK